MCLHVGPPHDSKSRLISASRECRLCCSSCCCYCLLLFTVASSLENCFELENFPRDSDCRCCHCPDPSPHRPSVQIITQHVFVPHVRLLFFAASTLPSPATPTLSRLPFRCTLHIIVSESPPLTDCLFIVVAVLVDWQIFRSHICPTFCGKCRACCIRQHLIGWISCGISRWVHRLFAPLRPFSKL